MSERYKRLFTAPFDHCADAALCINGSEAQIATFAKSWDLPAGRQSHAAQAMEGADLRCVGGMKASANGTDADFATIRQL